MEAILIAIAAAATGKATDAALKAGGKALGRSAKLVRQRFKRSSDFKDARRGDIPVQDFAARIYRECADDEAFRSALSTAADRNIDVSQNLFQVRGDVNGNLIHVGSGGTLNVVGPQPRRLREVRRATSDFVNHEQDLDTLEAALESGDWDEVALTGPSGVGKNAIAGLLAVRLDQHFHDGHIYVDLRDGDVRRALRSVLHRLNIQKDLIPDDIEGLQSLYVSTTSELAVLVVVDGAKSPEQALIFKPGSPAGQLLVLRYQWPESHRTLVHPIPDLAAEYAAAYLRKAFPDLTDEEIEQRIDGKAWRPSNLERLARKIAIELRARAEPDFLVDGTDEMLEASYLLLEEQAAWLYRLLCSLRGPEIESDLLLAIGVLDNDALQELLNTRLVVKTGDRYRVHARDFDHETVPIDVRSDLKQAVHYYLAGAQRADPLIQGPDRLRIAEAVNYSHAPEFLSPDEALQWMDDHRDHLFHAVRTAQQCGWRDEQVALAEAMWPLFSNRPQPEADKWVYETAMDGLTDSESKARMLICLGRIQVDLREHRESESNLKEAVQLAGDNVDLVASAMEQLGWLYYRKGQLDASETTYLEGFGLAKRKRTKALMLKLLGLVYRDQGRDEEAHKVFGKAKKRFRKLRDVRNVAVLEFEIGALNVKTDPERHLEEANQAIQRLNDGGWTKPLIDALKRLGTILGGEEGQARIEAAKEIEGLFGIES